MKPGIEHKREKMPCSKMNFVKANKEIHTASTSTPSPPPPPPPKKKPDTTTTTTNQNQTTEWQIFTHAADHFCLWPWCTLTLDLKENHCTISLDLDIWVKEIRLSCSIRPGHFLFFHTDYVATGNANPTRISRFVLVKWQYMFNSLKGVNGANIYDLSHKFIDVRK